MVKAYNYSYESLNTTSYCNYVIASNEDEAKRIALTRINESEDRLKSFNIYEISLEEVRIKDLSAGDLVRLWICRK